MFKTIALIVVAIVVALLGYAATRPDVVEVRRSATIAAPPAKIFPFIDDLRQWTSWSPYERLDPAMNKTFTGPASGRGAAYAWEGNGDVGQGRMEITESTPSSRVVFKLDFLKPFEGHNVAEFSLAPQGNATQVTWVMRGPSPYVAKVMGIFFNLDQMIGKDFEAGLANLKAAAEK